jgi:hypothetical protein
MMGRGRGGSRGQPGGGPPSPKEEITAVEEEGDCPPPAGVSPPNASPKSEGKRGEKAVYFSETLQKTVEAVAIDQSIERIVDAAAEEAAEEQAKLGANILNEAAQMVEADRVDDQLVIEFRWELFNDEHPEIRQGAWMALSKLIAQRSQLSKADIKAAAKIIAPSYTPQIVQGKTKDSKEKPKKEKKASISSRETALRAKWGPDFANCEGYKTEVRALRVTIKEEKAAKGKGASS